MPPGQKPCHKAHWKAGHKQECKRFQDEAKAKAEAAAEAARGDGGAGGMGGGNGGNGGNGGEGGASGGDGGDGGEGQKKKRGWGKKKKGRRKD